MNSNTKVVNIKSEYDIFIGRPSKWGNPFTVKEYGREKAIEKYRLYIKDKLSSGELTKSDFKELHNKRLGCFCYPKKCHGDILKRIVDLLFENNLNRL